MDRPTSVRRTSGSSLKPGVPKSFDGLEIRRTGQVGQLDQGPDQNLAEFPAPGHYALQGTHQSAVLGNTGHY
jgi:hypothetical protein